MSHVAELIRAEADALALRGASYLDGINPGWWERVDLGTLSMQSVSNCVLGQLYGDYTHARDHVLAISQKRCEELGFDVPVGHHELYDYGDLTAAWWRLIQRRRASV